MVVMFLLAKCKLLMFHYAVFSFKELKKVCWDILIAFAVLQTMQKLLSSLGFKYPQFLHHYSIKQFNYLFEIVNFMSLALIPMAKQFPFLISLLKIQDFAVVLPAKAMSLV